MSKVVYRRPPRYELLLDPDLRAHLETEAREAKQELAEFIRVAARERADRSKAQREAAS